jgi:DNA-directed RNA polymerase subunit RPC12/RpoP
MPLVLIIAVVAFALMYYRYRTSGLSRNCRWRRINDRNEYECAYCGAKTFAKPGKTPDICLRDSR